MRLLLTSAGTEHLHDVGLVGVSLMVILCIVSTVTAKAC